MNIFRVPDWKPNTDHQVRKQRAQMLHDIRAFFYERDVLEVETPALSQAANTDPYIESFQTNDNACPRFLHTSPEYPMKRLLASGSGDIYQIAKVWRQAELGANHNPEFSLLEWYRVGFSYQQLIQEVDLLLSSLLSKIIHKPSLIVSYQQLFLEKLNINPHTINHAKLMACVHTSISGFDLDYLNDLSIQDLLDLLLTHCIEPDFKTDKLTFVIDYPVTQSALAMIGKSKFDKDLSSNNQNIAMRFEVYFGDLELGNGYQELIDYDGNCQVLKSENKIRDNVRQKTQQLNKQTEIKTVPEDTLFLEAIKNGLPECAGVAIGLDRVLMAITGKDNIKQVINFPWDKA